MTTHFGLIIIGDEILSGKRADKHLPKAIELLTARGLSLSFAEYVGDEPDRITATLARAFAGARDAGHVVFSCGGIGATPDDHTRQCAARAWGRELALHVEAKRLIEERMQDVAREQGTPFEPDRPDNQHRLNMGVFPLGAQIIPNPYNKIPGFMCLEPGGPRELNEITEGGGNRAAKGRPEQATAPSGPRELNEITEGGGNRAAKGRPEQATAPSGGSELHAVSERGGGIYFLPGFPVMAWPMMEWVLDQRFGHLHRTSSYTERSVIVMGSMEATLTPLMLAIEASHHEVKVFSLPSVDHPQYGRHIELGVKGAPDAVNRAFPAMLAGLHQFNLKLGPELVR